MKHLPGSLRNLVKGYAPDMRIEKGYFPHLFNTIENFNYKGPIPPRDDFDIKYVIKDAVELESFNRWHDSWQGREWCLREELAKYCKNDVDCLAIVLKRQHEIGVELVGFSPWLKVTGPGVSHDFILRQIRLNFELDSPDMQIMRKEDPCGYNAIITEYARDKGFSQLLPAEHFFAQGALRGGKTDVKQLYLCLSEEAIARGERIRYDDFRSHYPAQQLGKDHPVGVPEIIVYDERFRPCDNCAVATNFDDGRCTCGPPKEYPRNFPIFNQPFKRCYNRQPTKMEILARGKDYGGFVYAKVKPPTDMLHPILHHFDKKTLKCLAPCYVFEGHFPMNEFCLALENGYEAVHVYRIDWYHMGNLWKDACFKLYMVKDMSSGQRPSKEQWDENVEMYEKKFELGDDYNKYWDGNWGKNPAVKQAAKTTLNSTWGKNAQNPFKSQTKVINKQHDDVVNFCDNLHAENFIISSFTDVSRDVAIAQYKCNTDMVKPDLSKGYMPAAVYIAAEGRIELGNALRKLGKRVLYHDTDSIIYHHVPGEYCLPYGKLVGDWEREDIDADNDGIREFVGMGPKSYGVRTVKNGPALKGLGDRVVHKDFDVILYRHDEEFTPVNGRLMNEAEREKYGISDLNIGIVPNYVEMVKCKGIRTAYAHREIFNFETMKNQVLNGLAENDIDPIKVPQLNFIAKSDGSMISHEVVKRVRFNENALKGFVHEMYLYPHGYNKDQC